MTSKACMRVRTWMASLAARNDAATAAEYAILLALITLVAVGTIAMIGQRFYNLYVLIANAVGGTI